MRLVVADGPATFRAAIAARLVNQPTVTIVGEAVRGHHVLGLVRETNPNVLLIDHSLIDVHVATVVRQLPGLFLARRWQSVALLALHRMSHRRPRSRAQQVATVLRGSVL